MFRGNQCKLRPEGDNLFFRLPRIEKILHSLGAVVRIKVWCKKYHMETELLAADPPAALLKRAAKGDAEAFAGLVQQHQRMVFSITWHFFRDATLAEDLAQDVFLQFFQSLREIRSESHLVFWLRQVATRKCIDHARRLQRQGQPPLDL